ncbi:MAG: F0F1 ATP synthase subunit B [Bacteroidales bacterium]|nr:F0F1 ATP synthase subunit B [Bacteroidales bacterium]
MGLLQPHTGTVIWMLIAFLTVFFVLKKFAWKPLMNALKMREDTIENALRSAEITQKEMEKMQADNEKTMAEAKKQRDIILKEAKNLKEQIIIDAKEQAALEANKIISDAKANIKSEKDAAISEIKEHAASLSISIAEKLLKEKLASEEDQKELIDRLLRDTKMN